MASGLDNIILARIKFHSVALPHIAIEIQAEGLFGR
jgi:hypothetical protein